MQRITRHQEKRYFAFPKIIILVTLASVVLLAGLFGNRLLCRLPYPNTGVDLGLGPKCKVPQIIASRDDNGNGILDAMDIVAGARRDAEKAVRYDSSYYQGGYPPEDRGACTDVVWRAFKAAGYDLKAMVDDDIRQAPSAYGKTGKQPDPNIDFRRVSNLQIFLQRHSQALTTEVEAAQVDNLSQWQPGDIVVFGAPLEHIGVISDRRLRNGIPLVIHNAGPVASEANVLLRWPSAITGHYRFITDN